METCAWPQHAVRFNLLSSPSVHGQWQEVLTESLLPAPSLSVLTSLKVTKPRVVIDGMMGGCSFRCRTPKFEEDLVVARTGSSQLSQREPGTDYHAVHRLLDPRAPFCDEVSVLWCCICMVRNQLRLMLHGVSRCVVLGERFSRGRYSYVCHSLLISIPRQRQLGGTKFSHWQQGSKQCQMGSRHHSKLHNQDA